MPGAGRRVWGGGSRARGRGHGEEGVGIQIKKQQPGPCRLSMFSSAAEQEDMGQERGVCYEREGLLPSVSLGPLPLAITAPRLPGRVSPSIPLSQLLWDSSNFISRGNSNWSELRPMLSSWAWAVTRAPSSTHWVACGWLDVGSTLGLQLGGGGTCLPRWW